MSLNLTALNFRYPGTDIGIHDIDLFIGHGELVAVIGSSGSGKTTLLKLIAGFESAQSGSVSIDGEEITHLPVRERQLGIVFQSYALFPHMTAWENVAYPLKVRKFNREDRRKKAFEALARVGLDGFENRHPTTMSGGQQQRVALARALVFTPKALLLDEPLSALDASLRGEMRDEILRLQREFNIATIHITHDQEEALSMADRVAVMEAGRLVQVATPLELYDNPATRTIAGFVGESNLWEGSIVSVDAVNLPFGRLQTRPHGLKIGQSTTVLVRPENVRIGQNEKGCNHFTGTVVRDRFFGASRRFDLAVGPHIIKGQTGHRCPIDSVNIHPDDVKLLENLKTEQKGE
jgi:putative spermidine/putrescine transport system ATP-binding protein